MTRAGLIKLINLRLRYHVDRKRDIRAGLSPYLKYKVFFVPPKNLIPIKEFSRVLIKFTIFLDIWNSNQVKKLDIS